MQPLYCAVSRSGRAQIDFAALHESAVGTFRPFSNVRHSVVVEGKPDIETDQKWSE
jgi:hypothetical protein